VNLLMTNGRGEPIHSRTFNVHTWKPSLRAAGVDPTRDNGMHVLRHTYASVLLDAGESVKALSLYLGHADPGFTLRVYTHLMPTSEDRTRRAIDRALRTPDE
jgi:integrase